MGEKRINGRIFGSISLFILAFAIVAPLLQVVYGDIIQYQLTTSTSGIDISGTAGHFRFAGESAITSNSDLIGREINTIEITVSKVGSPSGNVTLGVWDLDGGTPTVSNYLYRFGTFNAATLASGAQVLTYTNNATTHTIAEDDAIGILFANGGLTDKLSVPYHVIVSVSPYDGADSGTKLFGGGVWSTSEDDRGDSTMTLSLIAPDVCEEGYWCFDFDGDGVIDHIQEDDGSGIIQIDYSDIPALVGPVSESAPNFIRAITGLNLDTAILVLSTIVHALVVFGPTIPWVMATKKTPPMFVWAFLMVLAGGISVAGAGMPLLFFFVELALVVGGVAAMVKQGVGLF